MKKIIMSVLFLVGLQAYGQDVDVDQLINSKKFSFHATSTIPQNSLEISKVMSKMAGAMGSGNILLNPNEYYVDFSELTIQSHLPFYGRAYSAEISTNESGLKFESKDFSSKVKKTKRGNHQVDYKINDGRSARSLNLNISPGGQAMLVVVSNNRESITFNGYIKAND